MASAFLRNSFRGVESNGEVNVDVKAIRDRMKTRTPKYQSISGKAILANGDMAHITVVSMTPPHAAMGRGFGKRRPLLFWR